ncbi:follistatin-like [Drosophila guanche]|uniref:Kazal-like domain-containing protein n=1 Tax=Drosophila guanche TaxID=7266 RepID=A0A3B0JEA2_DROGU|nr:follistatin-like isoform X1 [Drosophila guanche]XP_034127672.1 follistatin-like isoform X2 [Drosophila guanche]XP_034140890.1 follistatin-like [Drosophila guanche]SPP80657.1 Hypothetical predicted protein [Drosophila guanche]
MKSFLSLCVILAVALSQVEADCTGACPDTEEVVWALGPNCQVFRNKCYFDKANCKREPPLTITTKEKCQTNCIENCPAVYRPVYVFQNGEMRTFGNACEKNAHTCLTGETFLE